MEGSLRTVADAIVINICGRALMIRMETMSGGIFYINNGAQFRSSSFVF
jgi:hypothetical protein